MPKEKTTSENPKFEIWRLLGCIIGALVYAAGINLFVTSAGLYTGGLVGFSQLIRTVLIEYFHLPLKNIDIAGIIYYAINIPIFVYAFPRMGKLFFAKTFITVSVVTASMSFIPPLIIMSDRLTACIVGAIVSGFGAGVILCMGSSAGGMDTVGMTVYKSGKNLSVGNVNLTVNIILYGICLFLFDIETVIYSLLYAIIYSFVMDKVHIQNINAEVKIITKANPDELEHEVFSALGRGVTEWKSIGAYTHENSRILYILISKYEIPKLKAIVHKYDRDAFIVVTEGIHVEGNYIKKL